PIYLAGYLLMIIPLTLWRTWAATKECSSARVRSAPYRWSVLGFVCLGLLQLGAFFLTGTRGGLIGLVAAVLLGSVLLGTVFRIPLRLVRRLTALLLVLVAVGSGLVMIGGALGISWLARYSETLSRREQSAMARVGFWRAARHLVFPDE